jgi:hypothetical protein
MMRSLRVELAPSPSGVEVCSCDESLALRAELAAARARIALLERGAAVDARQLTIVGAWHAGDGVGHD